MADGFDELAILPDGDPLPLLEDGEVIDVKVISARVRSIFAGDQTVELRCQVLDGNGYPRT